MLFVIHALDKEGGESTREAHYAAHRGYLSEASTRGVNIIMSGPLVKDDNVTPIGSLFVVEAADRETAEKFHHSDPFFAAGLWETSSVIAFLRRR